MCKCPHAHITIERSLRHSCLGVYCVTQFMADGITTPVPYSLKVHCMASVPRASPGSDVAGWHLGRLFLQLLPLVSNKHMISLSLSSSADHFRGVLFKGGDDYACSAVATGRTLVYIEKTKDIDASPPPCWLALALIACAFTPSRPKQTKKTNCQDKRGE